MRVIVRGGQERTGAKVTTGERSFVLHIHYGQIAAAAAPRRELLFFLL